MPNTRRRSRRPRNRPNAAKWKADDSELESFDENELEWEVQGFVSDFIKFEKDLLYEVDWKDWARSDGTSTTWEPESEIVDSSNIHFLHRWKQRVDPRRTELALKNPREVFLQDPESDFEDTEDAERAWRQILKQRARNIGRQNVDMDCPLPFRRAAFFTLSNTRKLHNGTLKKLENLRNRVIPRDEDRGIVCILDPEDARPNNYPYGRIERDRSRPHARKTIRPPPSDHDTLDTDPTQGYISDSSLTHASQLRSRSSRSSENQTAVDQLASTLFIPSREESVSSQEYAFEFPDFDEDQLLPSLSSQESLPLWETLLSDSDSDDLYEEVMPSHVSRLELELAWNQIATQADAAPITIVNEFAKDVGPILPGHNFQYVEQKYIYADDIPDNILPDVAKEFMIGCSHDGPCTFENNCECLESYNGDAYDEDGLVIRMPEPGCAILECNANCECAKSSSISATARGKAKANSQASRLCYNRVTQSPRQYPIEIFKTSDRGWGIRSPAHIPNGAVLGFYTGKLMKRGAREAQESPSSSYCYDLDMQDIDEEFDGYTVCAYNYGNWTRFVNHSCDPVAMVIPVVYDVPISAEAFIAKLAFVAGTDIPPYAEITIDYTPHLKKTARIPKDSPPCKCQSPNCRGYLLV